MRKTTFEGVELADDSTLEDLLKKKRLYTLSKVAEIVDKTPRYLRLLCRTRAIDHHKLFGRYYMTPREVADLMVPVKGAAAAIALAADNAKA